MPRPATIILPPKAFGNRRGYKVGVYLALVSVRDGPGGLVTAPGQYVTACGRPLFPM